MQYRFKVKVLSIDLEIGFGGIFEKLGYKIFISFMEFLQIAIGQVYLTTRKKKQYKGRKCQSLEQEKISNKTCNENVYR